MSAQLSPRMFLKLAFLVEGGLIVLALGLAWGLELPLDQWLFWSPEAFYWGVGATVPLCLIFGAAYVWPLGSYRRIKDFLQEALGPSIAGCRWYELLLVAALAGIGEEMLFRGIVQAWMEQSEWGYLPSLIISNVVFGLCHAITVTYALLAFGMGVFLGWLMDAPPQRNLLAPMLTHGLYDFFAFCLIAYDWRKHEGQRPEAAPEETPAAESDDSAGG